jgi:hypothetical protein
VRPFALPFQISLHPHSSGSAQTTVVTALPIMFFGQP